MLDRRLFNSYYEWLVGIFADADRTLFNPRDYSKLLKKLYSTTFIVKEYDDLHRSGDGLFMRSCFSTEVGLNDFKMEQFMDIPCNMLEMLVGLSARIEREYLGGDWEEGNRTWLWFYSMLDSLGLSGMKNRSYASGEVEDILFEFMNYEVESNGKGSLFYIPGTADGARLNIWAQMDRWVGYVFEKGDLYGRKI